MITPHSNAWYDRLGTLQSGYFDPWQSTLGRGDGESVYLNLVQELISRDADVLDAGCGHGDVVLEMAPLCRSIIGYDRVQSFIDAAENQRVARDCGNARFVCHDSHQRANDGHARIPLEDNSIDLVISRRGPTHWVEDARRVCRPGSQLVQLNPMGRKEEPIWNPDLPEPLRLPEPTEGEADSIVTTIEGRLAAGGLCLDSAWTFDVPEWLHAPLDLYRFLTFGEAVASIPAWEEVEEDLTRVFLRHAGAQGLENRHRRFLWKAVVS